jgi:hypothetical protein
MASRALSHASSGNLNSKPIQQQHFTASFGSPSRRRVPGRKGTLTWKSHDRRKRTFRRYLDWFRFLGNHPLRASTQSHTLPLRLLRLQRLHLPMRVSVLPAKLIKMSCSLRHTVTTRSVEIAIPAGAPINLWRRLGARIQDQFGCGIRLGKPRSGVIPRRNNCIASDTGDSARERRSSWLRRLRRRSARSNRRHLLEDAG